MRSSQVGRGTGSKSKHQNEKKGWHQIWSRKLMHRKQAPSTNRSLSDWWRPLLTKLIITSHTHTSSKWIVVWCDKILLTSIYKYMGKRNVHFVWHFFFYFNYTSILHNIWFILRVSTSLLNELDSGWILKRWRYGGFKGNMKISSNISPLVGMKFLVIPFAFDFAFKMHIEEKSSQHSIN